MLSSPHSFHIPVMGTGFTLDTPLRVARYGITSVISLVDDVIIEQARKYHSRQHQLPFTAIKASAPDARARRITAYLDLVDELVARQVRQLRQAPFDAGSDICRYFELLPPSPLRDAYLQMQTVTDTRELQSLQAELRRHIVPGRIDVNIMTKLDMDRYRNGAKLPAEFADAMAALRGFAKSTLRSAMVFSAGINQRLYTYAACFDDFFPCDTAGPVKSIILKVSDYRSALVQGKFLAKRGLWISEFRIESGLNCGGHAFAADCNLMGPVLELFKQNRQELTECLFRIYAKALAGMGRHAPTEPPPIRVTVQGGIGTAEENNMLLQYYQVDGTGWGTPFMVVPEVTNVDSVHLERLCNANKEDIYLSDASPLGVPFWNLRTSASERQRQRRIATGRPGSDCPKGYARINSEFTDKPICTASREYVALKLSHLPEEELSEAAQAMVREAVLAKACICHDLGGSVSLSRNGHKAVAPAVCCGPNIRNFRRTFSLDEMVNHIYGRLCVMVNHERSHMFLEEMRLNKEYLCVEIKRFTHQISNRPWSYFESFKKSLLEGTDYYQDLACRFFKEKQEKFLQELQKLRDEIERITPVAVPVPEPAH
ncbi:hypothetical protein [Desulfatitalea alkaliphila]|uniref:Uncharacterized protein n=1 Tax=Desulfatitalea alkaliphila TaxID=2929485 RepID=A0AA41R4E1_9BACT|nr:hypothetical protein [Desulfatitalea alkaliphila]MCJ8501258.1 hypothetical protein [Desulfatitalea alkaliphila]